MMGEEELEKQVEAWQTEIKEVEARHKYGARMEAHTRLGGVG